MSIFNQLWQGVSSRRAVMMLMTLCVLGVSLAACGKKPAHVDPPPDVVDDQYPRIYPDPKGE